MNLFSFAPKPELSLLVDIRDTTITIAAGLFAADVKPELVLCKTMEIDALAEAGIQDRNEYRKYLDAAVKTLDAGLISMRKELIKIGRKEKIASYAFFVGSPWSVSESKLIHIAKDKPFEVTASFLKKIIASDETESERRLGSGAGNTWRILEEKIVEAKLNGYAVEAIFGKKTNVLDLELFTSFVPYEVKDKLQSVFDTATHLDGAHRAHSTALSSYSFLRDLYHDKNTFLSIDVGDLVTDITFVQNDVMSGIASFPCGLRSLLKSGPHGKGASDIAASAAVIDQEGHLDEKARKDLEKALMPGVELWRGMCLDAIGKICTEITMPAEAFVIPKNAFVHLLFKLAFRTASGEKLAVLGRPLDIHFIGEEVFDKYVTNAKAYRYEPYAKMHAVFFDKTMKNHKH